MTLRNPKGQLGRALTIVYTASVREEIMHEDVAAFGAPSECHALVSKGADQRMRAAYRHACAVSGLKRREFAAVFNALPEHVCGRIRDQLHARMNPFRASFAQKV